MTSRISDYYYSLALVICVLASIACASEQDQVPAPETMTDTITMTPDGVLYLGADLSYVNEMEDCGGVYRDMGEIKDVFTIFKENKANLVRVRLWHQPDWTNYSNLDDVIKTIRRSKQSGLSVLLDFHYSDDWADPGKQIIPAAWSHLVNDDILGDSVYNYTFRTLEILYDLQLLPDFVQVGNEINSEILVDKPTSERNLPIDWKRNIALLNKGIRAVRDIADQKGSEIGIFIHIAQPENAFYWFDNAFANGIESFDWIGLSYYPKWSSYAIQKVSEAIDSLRTKYGKRVMIIETGYPYSLEEVDMANNLLGSDALVGGYPATPEGQRDYLIELTQQVINGGGEGVIYWEPAWISTPCSTRWGTGSHWDNSTFFNAKNENNALVAFEFFSHEYKFN